MKTNKNNGQNIIPIKNIYDGYEHIFNKIFDLDI